MAVDYEKLGELIDGYGGISTDVLRSKHAGSNDEVALLRSENARLRAALADVQLVLTGLRGAVAYTGDV